MGYDQPKTLGSREFGAQLALPIWVEYMQRALRGVPQSEPAQPQGVTSVDGELFYSDMTPGNGFVASIGLDSANPTAGVNDAVGGVGPAGLTPPAVPPPSVSSNEKKQIMDLFESNKP
jgi:penicillin-binding protein 1A